MADARPEPVPAPVRDLDGEQEHWPKLVVRVPPTWKRWLEEAAQARALSVAAVVRQCIRDLMIRRHDSEPPA